MKIRYFAVGVLVFTLGGIILFGGQKNLHNKINENSEPWLIYGERNFLLNNTLIKQVDIKNPNFRKDVFQISGIAQKIKFIPQLKSFLYVKNSDQGKELIYRDARQKETTITTGDISGDFVVDPVNKLLAYSLIARGGHLDEDSLQIHVFDFKKLVDNTVYKLDLISQGVVLLGFSLNGQNLYFDTLEQGIYVSGSLNVLDLDSGNLIQTWQAPARYGQADSPVLDPQREGYAMIFSKQKEGLEKYENKILYIVLDKGSEHVLLNFETGNPWGVFQNVFWGQDGWLYFSVKDGSPKEEGVWKINPYTLQKQRVASGNIALWAGEDEGIVYKSEDNSSTKVILGYENSAKSQPIDLVEGENVFYIGVME